MTLRVRVAAVCCVLTMCATAWAERPERWDRYLDGHRGPYRGRVIDADTHAPLSGVVVVAYWSRDRIYPLHSVNEPYAVREVATDPGGLFVLRAKDIEERAPRRTRHPEFRIFAPGYGSYPKHQKTPVGFLGGIFWGAGTTVELLRLDSRQTRLENLHHVDPHNFSGSPFVELPLLTRAFNDERIALGLEPVRPPEGKQ